MKKHNGFKKMNCFVLLMLAALLFLNAGKTFRAEIIPPYGEGQIGLEAVVLCESLTVRQRSSTGSKAVKTLPYGSRFIVVRQENGWAECIFSDAVDAAPEGWVNADYIAIDPAWFRTDKATPVYAWNDTSAPKVALLDTGTMLPVLKEGSGWVLVSLRGAVGWIRTDAAVPE